MSINNKIIVNEMKEDLIKAISGPSTTDNDFLNGFINSSVHVVNGNEDSGFASLNDNSIVKKWN